MTNEDAIKMLNTLYSVDVYVNEALDVAIKALEERPQGKWGKHGECPFCSYIRQWEDDKFCGNCGAEMKGGEK